MPREKKDCFVEITEYQSPLTSIPEIFFIKSLNISLKEIEKF